MNSVASCAQSSAATFCSVSTSSSSTSGTTPSETISAESSSLEPITISSSSSSSTASSTCAQSQVTTTSFDLPAPASSSSFAAIESEVFPSSVIIGSMSSFPPTTSAESSQPRESAPASPSAAISDPQESSIATVSSIATSVQAMSSVSEDSPSTSLSPEPSSSDVPPPSPPPSSTPSSSQESHTTTSNDPTPTSVSSATTNASKEESTQAGQGPNKTSSPSTDARGPPSTVAAESSRTQTPNPPSPQATADGQRSAEPTPVTTLNASAPIFQQPTTAHVDVSTAPDGSISTSTESSAPSSVSGAASSSFFDNKGAVAGTFTAVGIVVVAIAVLLAMCRRRRLRRDRHISWLHGFQRPSSPIPIQEDPFRDSYSPPPMRQRSPTAAERRSPQQTQTDLYKNLSTPAVPGTIHGPAIGASVGAGGMGGAVYNTSQPSAIAYGNPFDDAHSPTNAAYGLATTGSVSSGRTTPSVYSGISGPDKDSDIDEPFYLDPDMHSEASSYPHATVAPPPRTYTQGKVVRVGTEWRPISPPTTLESYTESRPQSVVRSASTSSGHNNNISNLKIQTSPRLSPTMVLQRKTLLNVRRHKPGSSEDSGHSGWTKI